MSQMIPATLNEDPKEVSDSRRLRRGTPGWTQSLHPSGVAGLQHRRPFL